MNKRWLIRTFSKTLTRSSSSFRTFCSQTNSTFEVKKVTKNNFDSALEDLKHHVRAADFVSIDLEMTGITSSPWREIFEYDRSDIQYLKIKDSVEKFAVVQFGVCSFRWDSSKESFITHPYTFYVFPRKELPLDGPCDEFLCQTSSLDFLAKYQFDFNACIYEGISYLSRVQEDEALTRLKSDEDEFSSSVCHSKEDMDIPSVGIADILFTERMKNIFCEWRDDLLRNTDGTSQFQQNTSNSKSHMQVVFFKMHPALELNGFTSHQLRLIQLVLRKHFKDLIYIRASGENAEQKLVVYTNSDNDKHLLMKEVMDTKRKEAEAKVKSAVGFRHVIDLLSTEKKLVVGHNCFLDVAHIHSKFLGPLPSTVEEYASSIHNFFPFMVDTKYVLSSSNVIQCMMKKKSSTSLSKAYAFLCPQISSASTSSILFSRANVKFDVQVDEMRSSNWNSGAKHEAGYDAFMTGCVFAQACSHLDIDFKSQSESTAFTCNKKLQKYINILYVSWKKGSIIDLNTGKESLETSFHQNIKQRFPKVTFENIVVLWGFSSNLKQGIMKDCLSRTFGTGTVTSIHYLDKSAALIQFSKKELVSDLLALRETLVKNNDAISVLHPLQNILNDGKTQAADYEGYKEICSSSNTSVLFADQAKVVNIRRMTGEKELRRVVDSQEVENSCSVYVHENDTGLRYLEKAKNSSDHPAWSVELIETLRGSGLR